VAGTSCYHIRSSGRADSVCIVLECSAQFETLEGARCAEKNAENRCSSSALASGYMNEVVVASTSRYSQIIPGNEPAPKLRNDGSPNSRSNVIPPPVQTDLPQKAALGIETDIVRITTTSKVHKSRTRITMNCRSFQRLDCIGRGGSARVYRVLTDDFRILALKKVSLRGVDEVGVRGFKGEIELLEKLVGVDRVVKLIDWDFDFSTHCLNLVCSQYEYSNTRLRII